MKQLLVSKNINMDMSFSSNESETMKNELKTNWGKNGDKNMFRIRCFNLWRALRQTIKLLWPKQPVPW